MAKNAGQIKGLIPHLLEDGLSILRYEDDTIIFMDPDLKQAKYVKLLSSVFEQLSGLKFNFHRNEIFYYGEAKQYETEYRVWLPSIGSYPFRYLGILMHHTKLHNTDRVSSSKDSNIN